MSRIVNRVPTLRTPARIEPVRSYSSVNGWHFTTTPESVDAVRKLNDQIRDSMARLKRKGIL
jgi:hypothetical protein